MAVSKNTIATLFALSISVTTAMAQQPVLTLPFYGYDSIAIDASVVAADGSATTLKLMCADSNDDCGLFPLQTLTVGPSTYNMYMSDSGFTGTQDCSTQGTTSAVCMESADGSEANFPGSSTTTYEGTDVAVMPVTITAGAEKLSAAGGSASTGAGPARTSATATSSPGTASGASSATTGTTSSSGARSSTSSGAISGSTAATSPTGAAVAHQGSAGMVAAAAGLLGCVFL